MFQYILEHDHDSKGGMPRQPILLLISMSSRCTSHNQCALADIQAAIVNSKGLYPKISGGELLGLFAYQYTPKSSSRCWIGPNGFISTEISQCLSHFAILLHSKIDTWGCSIFYLIWWSQRGSIKESTSSLKSWPLAAKWKDIDIADCKIPKLILVTSIQRCGSPNEQTKIVDPPGHIPHRQSSY